MNRRDVIRGGAVGGALATVGGFGIAARWGANPTLTLRNRFDEAVTLDLTVSRGRDDPTVVHESTVEVPAESTATRDILGDAWYDVVVRWNDRVLRAATTPRCNDASTRVTVTEAGDLEGRSVPCEGNPSEFTATNRTTDDGN